MKKKRIPISLSEHDHQLLQSESERTGLSRAEIMRQLITDLKIKTTTLALNPILRKITRPEWREAIKSRDSFKCNWCGKQGTEKTTDAHHRIPVRSGGTDTLENGVTYCRPCHRVVHEILKKIM